MSVDMNLPVNDILKELANSKNPNIIDFCNWLKEQQNDSVWEEPLINCINWRSPDLVYLNWYSTEHLEDSGLDAEAWRNYRLNDGSPINLNLTDVLMNAANEILEPYYDYEEDENAEDDNCLTKKQIEALGSQMTLKEACDLFDAVDIVKSESKVDRFFKNEKTYPTEYCKDSKKYTLNEAFINKIVMLSAVPKTSSDGTFIEAIFID